MEAIKIVEKAKDLRWNYDAEADVLYVSIGEPKKAIGVDVGEGTVLRFDEANREIVGITFIGLQSRLIKGLNGHATRRASPAKKRKATRKKRA